MTDETYSRHLLRRTARKSAVRWNVQHTTDTHHAVIRKTSRGPMRYRVVVVRRRQPVD